MVELEIYELFIVVICCYSVGWMAGRLVREAPQQESE